MGKLEIKDVHAQTLEGKKILRGVSLVVKSGEIHAIMGPNGGGKSTLAQVLMGHPAYALTSGQIVLDGTDITALPPNERSKLGLFLGFQYPVEVAGVNFAKFLRQVVNAHLGEGEKKLSPLGFKKALAAEVLRLGFSDELAERALNQGFSGGEKKKAEVLQMAMLKPKYAVLDEPDSGLDVDALRYIANSINATKHPMGLAPHHPHNEVSSSLTSAPEHSSDLRRTSRYVSDTSEHSGTNVSTESIHHDGGGVGLILITHYQRILSHIKPDFVHVIKNGVIVKSAGHELAHEIESTGYETLEG